MKEDLLKSSHLKCTKGREVILRIIQNSNMPITAEDVFFAVKKQADLNLSTVYRTLSTLTQKGLLLKQVMQDQKAYYQIATHAHKHILVCEECGLQTPIKDCPLHPLEAKIAKDTGFVIKGHSLEIFGVCSKCNNNHK